MENSSLRTRVLTEIKQSAESLMKQKFPKSLKTACRDS
jgi:hypothetical protein